MLLYQSSPILFWAGNRLDVKVVYGHGRPQLVNVVYQGLRQGLYQDLDVLQAGIDEVVEDEIYDPVFPAERHRRLGPGYGERFQPFTGASGEDYSQTGPS